MIDPAGRALRGLQEDRIFIVAAKGLMVRLTEGPFPFDTAPVTFHKPADVGFKETGRFEEANLNFRVVTKNVEVPETVFADIDLDYFDDKLAHIALEVIPNEVSQLVGVRKLTNPIQIYAYRWMAMKNFNGRVFLDGVEILGNAEQRPEFDPLYRVSAG